MKNQALTRWLTTGVILVTVAVLVTACGKKDEGGQVVAVTPTGPIAGSCVGCPSGVTLLSSGVGKAYTGGQLEAEMSLQFHGDTSTISQYQQQGVTPTIGNYSGPVVAGGVLRVRIARTVGCIVPAGDYTISTVAPGTWNGQSFYNLQLQATGPTTLQIRMSSNWVMSAVPAVADLVGAQFPFHVQGNAYINSMSGGICSAPFNVFPLE